MQNQTLKYLPTIDGLRAIAIFAVLISHSSQQLFGQFGVVENEFLITFASHGWMSYDAKYHLFAKLLPDAGSIFRTDTRMDSLLWGCFSALIYPSVQSCFERNCYVGNVFQTVVSLFLISVIIFSLPMIHFWTAFLFPLVVICTINQSKNVVGRILDHPVLSWFGRMSYSLYIWQTLFLQCQGTSFSLSHNIGGVMKLFYWMLDLASILLSALLSYYFVERKMIKFGRNLTQKLSPTK